MSHVIKVLEKFHVFDNNLNQKSEQIQNAIFGSYFALMLTNCIMTNLMLSENFDLLSLCVS